MNSKAAKNIEMKDNYIERQKDRWTVRRKTAKNLAMKDKYIEKKIHIVDMKGKAGG